MSKRNWKSYYNRVKDNSFLIGFTMLSIAIFSLLERRGFNFYSISPLLVFGGFFFIAILIKAIPPKKRDALSLLGQEVELDDLSSIQQKIHKVGLLGEAQVGKSTFGNFIRQKNVLERTVSISVGITLLESTPIKFLGILDGRGGIYAEQFPILESQDILLLFFDHNLLDGDPQINMERLKDHERFSKQIRSHCKGKNIRIQNLIIVMNKMDLWDTSSDKPKLYEWVKTETGKWEAFGFCNNVETIFHSNFDIHSSNELLSKIAKLI